MMTRADLMLVTDIQDILAHGVKDKDPRPRYADGTPAYTYFLNHRIRSYNLAKEFPICTLRPIAWKSAIREVLWIYQDASNSLDELHKKYGIHYWDEWESKDIPGTIGIRYGATVKRYNLMRNLLEDIKTNPYGRRHIMSLWQEDDFKDSDGLLPCAFLTIWNVREEYLDMMLIQRSGDMLAASGAGGINEVQYAALQIMVSKATGYKPGQFTHVVANEQIYDRHLDAAKMICDRLVTQEDKDAPYYRYKIDNIKLAFHPSENDFYGFKIEDFDMEGYNPQYPQIKLELGI